MKLLILCISLPLYPALACAADFKIKRLPAVENMRVLDIKLHAAVALGVSPKTVERLIMSKVENYEKITRVAFPLNPEDVEQPKAKLLSQLE